MAKKRAKAKPAAVNEAARDQAMVWITEGHPPSMLAQGLQEDFEQTPAEAARTIQAARDRIDQLAAEGVPTAWMLQAVREVYRRAMESHELGAALRALEKMERISEQLADEADDL